MIHEVAFLCLGIIIAFLSIGYVFFSSDGGRSKHIDMSCSMVIIQGKRVYHKVCIGDFHLCGELTFLRPHEVAPLLAGEYILFIEDFAIVKVISLLGIAVEEQFLCLKGHFFIAELYILFGNSHFGIPIVFYKFTIHF